MPLRAGARSILTALCYRQSHANLFLRRLKGGSPGLDRRRRLTSSAATRTVRLRTRLFLPFGAPRCLRPQIAKRARQACDLLPNLHGDDSFSRQGPASRAAIEAYSYCTANKI